MEGLKFYEGRKVEHNTKCKNKECKRDIVWYKIFRQPVQDSYICNSIIVVDENVSGATIKIINEYNDSLDVEVHYRCRFCDEYHNIKGKIISKDGKLLFQE